jgi:hypothetical protein
MRWFRLLLLIPLLLAVWTPLSDHVGPRLWGVPFLVWYHFLVVLIGMAVTGAVFFLDNRASQDHGVSQQEAERGPSR